MLARSVQFRYSEQILLSLKTNMKPIKTPSGTWKVVIRKSGWPTAVKTFRLKKDAEDWERQTTDEMVRGVFIKRSPSERTTFEFAMKRYLSEVTPSKRHQRKRQNETAQLFWLSILENIRWQA